VPKRGKPARRVLAQHTFEELEASLTELGKEYAAARAAGDAAGVRECRRLAIAAKVRARAVARRPGSAEDLRARKIEMAQWLLVWLEDPAIFPAWVEIRKRRW
jgi:hypothetical protein